MNRKQKQRVATGVLFAGWGMTWLAVAMAQSGAPPQAYKTVALVAAMMLIGGAFGLNLYSRKL